MASIRTIGVFSALVTLALPSIAAAQAAPFATIQAAALASTGLPSQLRQVVSRTGKSERLCEQGDLPGALRHLSRAGEAAVKSGDADLLTTITSALGVLSACPIGTTPE